MAARAAAYQSRCGRGRRARRERLDRDAHRAGDPRPGRAGGVCAARGVRAAVPRDRRGGGQDSGRGPPDRAPCPRARRRAAAADAGGPGPAAGSRGDVHGRPLHRRRAGTGGGAGPGGGVGRRRRRAGGGCSQADHRRREGGGVPGPRGGGPGFGGDYCLVQRDAGRPDRHRWRSHRGESGGRGRPDHPDLRDPQPAQVGMAGKGGGTAAVTVLRFAACQLIPERSTGLLSPQFTACFTSAPILASSVAVNSVSAKAVGHRAPSSRFALSLKPNVAYLVLNFCALWKKQTTLPSLAYAGIPYQVLGERAGALALMIAWSREPMARSGACISPIFASTALSPSALSAFSSWTRSLIAPRSSFVNPLIAFAGFFVAFLSTLSSVDMRWSPFCRVGQGKRVFPLSNKR